MGMQGYRTTQPNILRGTNVQTTDNLVYVPPNETLVYRGGGTTQAPVTRIQKGISIRAFELNNRSASTISSGMGFRIANRYWFAGTYNGTTYTDDTADAQSTTANSFIMGEDAANIDVVFFSYVPFDWLAINIGTAEVDAGAAVDHTVTYSNSAGTGWTTMNAAMPHSDTFTRTNAVWPAGANQLVWARPGDWGKITSITGLDRFIGMYGLRLTTAQIGVGDTAALASGIEIGTMPILAEGVTTLTVYAGEDLTISEPLADGIVAYFSTLDLGSSAYVECVPWG